MAGYLNNCFGMGFRSDKFIYSYTWAQITNESTLCCDISYFHLIASLILKYCVQFNCLTLTGLRKFGFSGCFIDDSFLLAEK
jgi:hypothetical protein